MMKQVGKHIQFIMFFSFFCSFVYVDIHALAYHCSLSFIHLFDYLCASIYLLNLFFFCFFILCLISFIHLFNYFIYIYQSLIPVFFTITFFSFCVCALVSQVVTRHSSSCSACFSSRFFSWLVLAMTRLPVLSSTLWIAQLSLIPIPRISLRQQ